MLTHLGTGFLSLPPFLLLLATRRETQIKDSGQINSIMTFYELTEGGDLVHTTGRAPLPWILINGLPVSLRPLTSVYAPCGTRTNTLEFYQLPEPLLRKALDVLIRQGKAQVLKGLGEDGDGVKFV